MDKLRDTPIDKPLPILQWKVTRFIQRKFEILSIFALVTLICIISLVGGENSGIILLVTGLFLSFIATLVMAIPHIPLFYSHSLKRRYINRIAPAIRNLRSGKSIDESIEGFHLVIYNLENMIGRPVGDPSEITPTGRYYSLIYGLMIKI